MKKNMSNKTISLALMALILTLGISVGGVMAYFTTYTEAKGEVVMDLGFPNTGIEEHVVDGKKEIKLLNTGDYDCYVRLKALTGDAYKDSLVYSEPDGAGKWAPGADGYYYYSDIVGAEEMTNQINVGFSFPVEEEGKEPPADFNVIIIQESTQVLYEEDGTPYADWNKLADVSQTVVK